MNTHEMRKTLAARYSPKFAKRLEKMNDDQVYAIWRRVMCSLPETRVPARPLTKQETLWHGGQLSAPAYSQPTLF